jgi:hypothetical protein
LVGQAVSSSVTEGDGNTMTNQGKPLAPAPSLGLFELARARVGGRDHKRVISGPDVFFERFVTEMRSAGDGKADEVSG